MHPTNYTLYHLLRYHIELIEAIEYSLITYKIDKEELDTRFKFLKEDYKKGFFNTITSQAFTDKSALTKELKYFLKHYNSKMINEIVNTHGLRERIEYLRDLSLAYNNSLTLINAFLNEEDIKNKLDNKLIDLINSANKYFNLASLFNCLNLFVASKVIILQGDTLYNLTQDDYYILCALITTIEPEIEKKSLYQETYALVNKQGKFNEEDAYELLNKISLEYTSVEKELYTSFESFSNKLQKEIRKEYNN